MASVIILELMKHLTFDQIIEIAEIAERKRTLEAARLLKFYLIGKIELTTLMAADYVRELDKFLKAK